MSLSKPSVYTAIWLRWQNKKGKPCCFSRCHHPLHIFPQLLHKRAIPILSKRSTNTVTVVSTSRIYTCTCASAHKTAKDISEHQHHESLCYYCLTLLPQKRSFSSFKTTIVPTINVQTDGWPCSSPTSSEIYSNSANSGIFPQAATVQCVLRSWSIWIHSWGHQIALHHPWALSVLVNEWLCEMGAEVLQEYLGFRSTSLDLCGQAGWIALVIRVGVEWEKSL